MTSYDYVYRKISKVFSVMNAMKNIFPFLYNSLVLLHFNYCLLIWGAGSTVVKLSLLKKGYLFLRIYCALIVTCSGRGYFAHTEPIFKKSYSSRNIDIK